MEQIINGVDVSGCVAFRKECGVINNRKECYQAENYCISGSCYCEAKEDCYYKQLRRKEEECNTYKQALDEIEKIAKECHQRWLNDEDERGGYDNILQIIQKVKGE